jgi:hypothetical protein
MDEWATQQKKNKALREYDGFFAARLVLGLIAIGASVVHTVMTFGASSAIAIVSIAKTVVAMGLDIQNHCRDMAKTEADIIKADDVLAKTWKNGTKSGGKVGRELAAALGVPFVKSIGGFGTLLKEYDAKNGRRGKLADDLWKKAKELMAKIAETSSKAGPEMKKKLTSLGAKVTDLLNQVGEIVSASTECDAFSASYHAHYDTYKAFEGKALSGVAKGSNIAVLAAGILSTADTILKVATALA